MSDNATVIKLVTVTEAGTTANTIFWAWGNSTTQELVTATLGLLGAATQNAMSLIVTAGLWLLSLWAKSKKAKATAQLRARQDEKWREAWWTDRWDAVYGLLHRAYRDEIPYAPIRADALATIQARFKQPSRSLERLLDRGVIPVRIHDGNVSTVKLRSFHINSTFPFIQLPLFRQAKTRAFFEFLLPHPHIRHQMEFLEMIRKKHDLKVVIEKTPSRLSMLDTGRSKSMSIAGALGGSRNRVVSVGAESFFGWIVPFKKDLVLEIVNDDNPESMLDLPEVLEQDARMLYDVPLAHVRIESERWDRREWDAFILDCTQKAGLPTIWTQQNTHRAALEVIDECRRSNAERRGKLNH